MPIVRVRRIVLIAIAIIAFASASRAQTRDPALELSFLVGGFFGGTLPPDTNALFLVPVDVGDGLSIGGRAAYKATNRFEVGAHLFQTTTQFRSSNTGPLFGGTAQDLGELRMRTLLGYGSVRLGSRRATPYLTFGAGATTLDPEICRPAGAACQSETKFTAAFGLAVKVFVHRRVGVRFDSHYYATALPIPTCPTIYRCDQNRWLSSGDATAGVVWAVF